jgi:hypothetical protein
MTFCGKSSPSDGSAGPTIGLAIHSTNAYEDFRMSHDAIHSDLAVFDTRSRQATQAAAEAFGQLLELAEEQDSGQSRRIARFLAATYNGHAYQFDPFELRAVDVAISDDMLCCLDALRWGRADLYTLVADGAARMRAVIKRWGLRRPESN